jgi:hypothetical protein
VTLPYEGPIHIPVPASLPKWAKTEVLSRVGEICAAGSLPNAPDTLNLIRNSLAISNLQTPVAVLGAFFVNALVDLAIQGWRVETDGCDVLLSSPSAERDDIEAEKRRVRAGHLVERDRQLAEPSVRSFIASMEETRPSSR